MEDLMTKLQSVLNDEESMKQIQELAGMLAAGAEESQSAAPSPPVSQNNEQNSTASGNFNNNGNGQNVQQNTASQNAGGFDLSQLLQGLNMGMGQPQNQNNQQNFDITKIMKLQQIMQAANKPDNNIALLMALRPLLREENKIKIDRLIKIFKLFAVYPLIKESGLGGDLLGLF